MCGICGVFDWSGAVVDEKIVDRMCAALIHRGPDDQGVYVAPFIGLGQRRLSIIDLSKKAAPPLPNEDESLWVVFNGEIYNFENLRKFLEERGHRFRSATDTEVILHLYEEYGIDCVHHLQGMFAFAIWDSRKKVLFAARDRLGKKPFYYARNGSSLVFGSEVSALLAHPAVSNNPDWVSLGIYLTKQCVPSPRTAFTGVNKLPPGHYLICKEDGTLGVTQYWSPPYFPEKPEQQAEDVEEQTLALLRECVRQRLVADVPLGAFLSGGIDSGLVVALMAENSTKPVKTFSIGFEGDPANELPFARRVAAQLWNGSS